MISYKKLLELKIARIVIVISLLALAACSNKSEEIEYVAKVNNSILTREEFASLVDTSTANEIKKNAVIRDWIHSEILYQNAEKEGILKEQKFINTIKQSERELAGAMLLQKLLSEDNYTPDNTELKNYFEINKNEFRYASTAYILNIIEFIDENKAISFRNTAVENGWNKAVSQIANDASIINQYSNKFLFSYQINPPALARLVSELYPNEISIVISAKTGYYSVAQLIERIEAGSTPALENIKDDIIHRLRAIRQQSLIDEYIKKLYSKSNIEIKTQDTNEN